MLGVTLFVPAICYAGLASVIGETFGPNGPGRAVIWIVGLDVGKWIIKTVVSVCGGGSSGKWIDYIVRSAQVGIVIASVYGLINTSFNLLGL
jgi:hypothetical protein